MSRFPSAARFYPEKISLFGSAARGDTDRDSDIDLLIIKDGADALDLMARIYGRLRGVGAAVDAIVVSPDDVERYKDNHALIIKPAVQDGRDATRPRSRCDSDRWDPTAPAR